MINYDFSKDWLMIKTKNEFPSEIISFMESLFLIMEIRERVGTVRGIKFEVRPREKNHNLPHVHAKYDKYEISIAIETGEVLAGNVPPSQQKIAIRWVRDNKEYLLGKWSDIAITATSITTKSRLAEVI